MTAFGLTAIIIAALVVFALGVLFAVGLGRAADGDMPTPRAGRYDDDARPSATARYGGL